MSKSSMTTEQIILEVNRMMAASDALDGDCKKCRVKRLSRLTEDDAIRLRRNWNVDIVGGTCRGECMAVLEATIDLLGDKYDAVWS